MLFLLVAGTNQMITQCFVNPMITVTIINQHKQITIDHDPLTNHQFTIVNHYQPL